MKNGKRFLASFCAMGLTLGALSACASEPMEIAFQVSNGCLQWQYVGESAWNDLYDLNELKGDRGAQGNRGDDGLSSYEIAVQQGYKGTEQQWLNSLKGAAGVNGKSAFEIAVENGFEGTEEEWLESLHGKDGADGKNGKSAYDTAVEQGFKGNEKEWLESLQGKDGTAGKSVFDVAKELGFEGTEEEWLASLKGATGDTGATGEAGADGYTPYIGENGNWWINETDTGVPASVPNMTGKGTDGLHFQAVIRSGVAGYEVVSYDGVDTDVVLPDEIFGQPVISIKQGALPKTITSVKLSKNTEYVPTFEDYEILTTFDFNNAPIEKIPNNMFYDSGLRSVVNYDKITEIGAYAFRNTGIINFNYSKITKIGSYAFYGVDWENLIDEENEDQILDFLSQHNLFLYIPENVTEIGANAFNDTSELPVYYGGSGEVDYAGTYFYTNVKHTEDGYYYRDMGGYASLLNYDGNAVDLVVPSALGGKALTAVEKYAFIWNGKVERIELPSTVSVIQNYAFAYTTKMHSLFIPSSIVTCGSNLAAYFDDDFGAEIPTLFFEAETFDYGSFSSSSLASKSGKYHFGVKPADIIDDDVCVYQKKTVNYEVVSIKNNKGLVKVPALVNGLPVTRIQSYALYSNAHMASAVDLPATITRISAKAFCSSSSLLAVNVPKSVADINNYGFYSLSNCTVYIATGTIPADWDSSWYYDINTYKLSATMTYAQASDYLYETVDGLVYLTQYLNPIEAGDTIVVPTTIDGKAVYGVRQYCYRSSVSNNSSTRINIVVPSSITIMEYYAVYFSQYYTYVNLYVGYTSSEGRPIGWNSNWIYTYSSSSSYRTYYYGDQWQLVNGVPVLK